MPEIKFEQVSLSYGKQEALHNITFTLQENTICGLLGRNGAGKTSLMALLASYRPATTGSITVDGKPVFDNEEIMPQIAFMRNRNEESNSLKVREYVSMAENFRPNWDREYAKRLLEQFEIPEKKAINALSNGQQAAVRGIVGLASRAPITLYDEVYQGMDAAFRKQFIQEILEDYTNYPRTILFSTHYIDEAESMFEKVIVLSEGNILVHDDCDTIRSKGVAVSGNCKEVDQWMGTISAKSLSSKSLGRHKEVVFMDTITKEQREKAKTMNLELSKPSLQDIFIHMTEKDKEAV